ncbi:group II intron maturase-specific domain-containing protein [Enterocloster clostridioformis]|uniref:RNA-directed DNA polymerase n=1 Tax=Enterocloster clostridioformis TaxID=1531 RepID=A0A2X2UQS2_9FIRM|nr:group II intron maturase-specific domain-containing protein [Enterocloster clostridioformis]MCA5580688.1 group II intron reverse transcriptase/maturase [Enterocloster clostridioformis]SQB14255.1 RNA-directed DNA polymerase [Enterocloster clostridioformis]
MGTENRESCSQRDSAERKGYVRAHRSFNRIWKERDSAEPDILSKILNKENLNRAYKRVKANKGAPGVDGMTIEAALPWLRENNYELVERIRKGKYTPSPVRRVEIPKPEGGIRKLGIPTVIDRIIQQAMLQQLMPIYEPLFSKDSFGYRPGRGAKDAILRIKEYIEQGYTRAVVLVLLAKSERAAERLLESSTKYLEARLKLRVNREKSRTVSVFAIQNFKFLGFCFGKNGTGTYIRVHGTSWKKAKEKLRRLTSRSRCGSIIRTMEKIKVYMRGWLNYYGIADMKKNIESLNGWLYRRIRMCIWKQWKLPKTRMRKLIGLGVDSHYAATIAYDRKGYWFNAGNKAVNWALSKERLINWGFYDLAAAYQSLHTNY